MLHSGSLRFYTGRLTVRWDWLDEPWLERAPADLESIGYRPFAVLEGWEIPEIRKRLGLGADAPLPWRIQARMTGPVEITVYDMGPGPSGSVVERIEPTAPRVFECEPPKAPYR